jgi:carbonic anhydrase
MSLVSRSSGAFYKEPLNMNVLSNKSGSLLIGGAIFCGGALAAASPGAQEKKPKDSAETRRAAAGALGQMMRDNGAFVHSHSKTYFDPFLTSQHPRAIVVACADSRFHLQAISSTPDGDVFEIRNIGNQVDSTGGSVQYGVHHLRTPLLMVVGHVGCGAVKAAMGDYSAESSSIRRELDGLHLSIRSTPRKGTSDQLWLDNVQRNVHQQVANALQEYRAEVKEGRLFVVGAVYDFRDELGEGRGRLHVINVNGESSQAKLREVALMQDAFRASSTPTGSLARR